VYAPEEERDSSCKIDQCKGGFDRSAS
jgi:hypothetical protein